MNYRINITPQQFLAAGNEVLSKSGNAKTTQKKENSTATAKDKEIELARLKLEKQISELNEKAKIAYAAAESANNDYGFKRLDYDTASDSELKKTAESGLSEKYSLLEQALTDENDKKRQSLEQEKLEIGEKTAQSNAALQSRYDKAKEQAGADAIKRGVARSSIITELLKEYDKQKLATIDENEREANKKIAEIDEEISGLTQKLNDSLKQYDMQKAIELNEKLDKLKAARDEKNAEALKYNNEVSETLLKYSEALKAANEKYKKQGDSYKNDMANAIMDYYSKLSAKQALEHFEKSGYAELLTESGRKIVVNYLNAKLSAEGASSK